MHTRDLSPWQHDHTFGQDRVADLHVWSIGPRLYAGEITIVSGAPDEPGAYRQRLARAGLAHATIEVQRCPQGEG